METNRAKQRLRKVLTVVLLVMIAWLLMSPQFAFLSFLFDASVLDIVLVLFGLQMLLFREQITVLLVRARGFFSRQKRLSDESSDP